MHRWRVLDGDLQRLHVDPEVILTGLSANDPRIDIRHDVSRDGLDAYVSEHKLKLLSKRLKAVEDSASPNLTLRVPQAADWVLKEKERAPSVVVAADLLDDPDERVRRAGRNLLLRSADAD
jgi:hypothetical protein